MEQRMNWKDRALDLLKESLEPVPSELNEIDWKGGLSSKTERLAQHISAFANQRGGGILVFGVNNDASLFSMSSEEIEEINKTLGNIAKNNLAYSISLEHTVLEYNGHSLLFVYIPEQREKPVSLRGSDIYNSFTRSNGHTVKMSRNQVRESIALSDGFKYEERIVKDELTSDEVLSLLNYEQFFKMLDKNIPTSSDSILGMLKNYDFIKNASSSKWNITNLGALLFARKLSDFPTLLSRAFIVRKYVGLNNRQLETEQIGTKGYAVGFENLVDYIMKNTSFENIEVLRENEPRYPRIAIRELVANALVHQDFSITGMPITIEIYSNRLVITNPGASLNDVNRLIDLPPHSRNEQLAQSLFMLGICERRGSGVDRAIAAIEEKNLPPIKFSSGEDFTRVTIYPQKNFKDMTQQEKIEACYQHACLRFQDNMSFNNQSLRERFQLDKNKVSVVSRIIADALEAGKIKLADEEGVSKKYVAYIPYYA